MMVVVQSKKRGGSSKKTMKAGRKKDFFDNREMNPNGRKGPVRATIRKRELRLKKGQGRKKG